MAAPEKRIVQQDEEQEPPLIQREGDHAIRRHLERHQQGRAGAV